MSHFFLSVYVATELQVKSRKESGRMVKECNACRFHSSVFTFKQPRDVTITAAPSAAAEGPRLSIIDLESNHPSDNWSLFFSCFYLLWRSHNISVHSGLQNKHPLDLQKPQVLCFQCLPESLHFSFSHFRVKLTLCCTLCKLGSGLKRGSPKAVSAIGTNEHHNHRRSQPKSIKMIMSYRANRAFYYYYHHHCFISVIMSCSELHICSVGQF